MSESDENGLLNNFDVLSDDNASTELESLHSLEELTIGESDGEDLQELGTKKRIIQTYRVLQQFDTAVLSKNWWNDENSAGWKSKSNRTIANGDQIVTYR